MSYGVCGPGSDNLALMRAQSDRDQASGSMNMFRDLMQMLGMTMQGIGQIMGMIMQILQLVIGAISG
jgi:hypothetical protein